MKNSVRIILIIGIVGYFLLRSTAYDIIPFIIIVLGLILSFSRIGKKK